ncbi:MAG TPA: glycosyltransferase [Opitutaceae bacterium]|nr:glycosyltransferase [Opitutaceae bacterium]
MTICDIAQFHSPLGGGVKRYLHDKRIRLEARPGCRHVLIIPSYRNHVTAGPGHAVYEIESRRLPGSKSYRMLLDKRRIMEAVRREKPDLIEIGDPYRTAWIGLEAGQQLGIPVVAFYHSDFPRALDRTIVRFSGKLIARGLSSPIRRYIRRLYNRMDATIVASEHLVNTLRRGGIQRIEHIPLGTDTSLFRPRDSRERVRAEFGVPRDARLLLFVGRLAREKGIKNLIGALDRLSPDAPRVHLALVGDGELDGWVHLEANHRPNLTWLPYCESAERLADLYSAADLFVHAGRWETFGIVSLEAQSCGTPVLAVRGGGLEESLSCEKSPLLAEDGTAGSLAAAIEAALARPVLTPATRAARHHALAERFSIERTFEQIFTLYQRLIDENRRSPNVAVPVVDPAGAR